jgi:hypothetical protein
MTAPLEPRLPNQRFAVAPRRFLLLADSAGSGPALLAALRRLRDATRQVVVHVVVPYRQPVGAGLLVGDPLAGWVALDSVAAHEWDLAAQQAAQRQLCRIQWLLWEMEMESTGEVLAEERFGQLLRRDGARYDSVLLVRPRFPLARWRQARWVRLARRQPAPTLELVREAGRRRSAPIRAF